MLARCAILERLSTSSSLPLRAACQAKGIHRRSHSISSSSAGRVYTALHPAQATRTPVRHHQYELLRIGGVRHYAVRSKEKRKAIREARAPPKPDYPPGHDPREEASLDYISSWDLHPNGLPYVRVENVTEEAEASTSRGRKRKGWRNNLEEVEEEDEWGRKLARNRWPTISTLDANLLTSADYVNISNLARPKILCFDGKERTSSVIEYGRRKRKKPVILDEAEKSGKVPTTPVEDEASTSKLKPWQTGRFYDTPREQARPALGVGEDAKPARPQHPMSDEDYVDSLLSPSYLGFPAATSSSFTPAAPPDTSLSSASPPPLSSLSTYPPINAEEDLPYPLIEGRDQSRTVPELEDPYLSSLLLKEDRRRAHSQDVWRKAEEKEREEREAWLKHVGGALGGAGKKSGKAKGKGKDRRWSLNQGKGKGKEGSGKKGEEEEEWERIPFPPGTKGFFYFHKPTPTTTSATSSSSAPSSTSHTSSPSPSQAPSPASGALRFRVIPLPLTDPRAFEESYDLPHPLGAAAGPWQVPLLVLRERGSALGVGGGTTIHGPLSGFWKLLVTPPKTKLITSSSSSPASRQPPTRVSRRPLLTADEVEEMERMLPPYMPRIGPNTKVLESVLDPFVMDLSVNDMSVVVVGGTPPPSLLSSSSSASRTSTPTSSSSTVSSSSSSPIHPNPSPHLIPHHLLTPSPSSPSSTSKARSPHHRIHYTKFENMLTPLAWTHHRGPFPYSVPAHIPLSRRFKTDRPALKALLWKRRVASPWTGQALVRFELASPPRTRSVHGHPLLVLRLLKYVVDPDPQPFWKRPKSQVVGRLLSRWRPQGKLHLTPWHPQRLRYPFAEELMQVLKERYWKPEWVEGRTERKEKWMGWRERTVVEEKREVERREQERKAESERNAREGKEKGKMRASNQSRM